MRQINIRFCTEDTVYGIRQQCPQCLKGDGHIQVKSVTSGSEEWWVPCPRCYGRGTDPEGPWIVEKFQVWGISWNEGGFVGSPELTYEQLYGDYDRRDYPEDCVFETLEEANEAVRSKNLGEANEG
jgi:hypothetical protein